MKRRTSNPNFGNIPRPDDIPNYEYPIGTGNSDGGILPHYYYQFIEQPVEPIFHYHAPLQNAPAQIPLPPSQNNNGDIDCSCLYGLPYIENGVCKCTNVEANTINDTKTPVIVRDGNGGQVLINTPILQQGSNQVDLIELAKANPLITIGLIGGLIYLFTRK
jgi:hypothetical protein